MISESAAERAAEWLTENATVIGEARAHVVQLEEHRKILKARLMRTAPLEYKSVSDRENWAYTHPDYLVAVNGLSAAHGEYEKLKHLVGAAEARIGLYRTAESSRRSG